MDRLEPTDMAIDWMTECTTYGNTLGVDVRHLITHAVDKADQQPTRVRSSLITLVGKHTADYLLSEIGDHAMYLGVLRLVCKRILSMGTSLTPTQAEKRPEYCERVFAGYIASKINQTGTEPGALNKEIAGMVISTLADKYF